MTPALHKYGFNLHNLESGSSCLPGYMKLNLLIAAICFLTNLMSVGQDISGTWIGNYEPTSFASHPEKLVVEIFVHNDSIITGASHLYYKKNLYEHYKINGVIRKKEGMIYFSEDSTIAVKLGLMEENCLGNYTLKLIVKDNTLRLDGRWRDNSNSIFRCPSSGVWLEKDHKAGVKKTLPKEQDKILERRSDIQSLVELSNSETDSILIEVFDNGIVDQDLVSIYLDDSLLIHKQLVTAKAITFYISVDKNKPISKLKLVAESLGSIPPCTVLMIVKTRKKKYEVNLSSTLNLNGVIEFFLKE